MSNPTEFWSRFNAWSEERADIQERDGNGTGIVSSSEWQGSDDDAFDLLETAVTLLRQPIKVWTCRVIDRENEEDTITLHSTEEACWESLRENFDPEGLSDDEPPVAIVEYLETEQGLRIDIDVHEVTR